MAVRGVTILNDVLRPTGQGAPGGADRPAAWLHSAVRRQIGLASGLDVTLLTPTQSPDLAAWLAVLREPAHADAVWASAFAAPPDDDLWRGDFARLVLEPLRERFCVGYELPPYLLSLLAAHGIPYIDIRIHPVRFLDDLLFAVRASELATQVTLSGVAVPESEVIATAGLREAMCRLISDARFPAPALLVVGQRRFDSTQIADGRFFEAGRHAAAIEKLCAAHRSVLLKAHPLDEEHSLLTVAQAVGGERVLGRVTDNLYRLLAMPEVTSVLTVSSSVAYEAPYFDKAVHTLDTLPLRLGWRGEAPERFTHASLDDRVLSVDFWRAVLATHAAVTPRDGMRLAPKPNRLRLALDSFWNFNEIDTDRLPRTA